MIKGNAVIGQSGGPTTVINSSLAGVVDAARRSGIIAGVYGMNYGIEGFMNEWLIDLKAQPHEIIHTLHRREPHVLNGLLVQLAEQIHRPALQRPR